MITEGGFLKMIKDLSKNPVAPLFLIIIFSVSSISLQSVQAQNQLSVSINVIEDGEYTKITGLVTNHDQEPIEGATVSIQAVDPTGKTVHFDLVYTNENGQFIDRFKTTEGFDGKDGIIYVSANKLGYENGSTQANFTAIPEFPTALTVSIISIVLALAVLKKRKLK